MYFPLWKLCMFDSFSLFFLVNSSTSTSSEPGGRAHKEYMLRNRSGYPSSCARQHHTHSLGRHRWAASSVVNSMGWALQGGGKQADQSKGISVIETREQTAGVLHGLESTGMERCKEVQVSCHETSEKCLFSPGGREGSIHGVSSTARSTQQCRNTAQRGLFAEELGGEKKRATCCHGSQRQHHSHMKTANPCHLPRCLQFL